tara:strand:+ start:7759 stop:8391 length:633 start_codon:yes stop_codon:yes gene_type:complete
MFQKCFTRKLTDRPDTDGDLIFDLDDTLGYMHGSLINHANRTYGLNEVPENWEADYSFVDLAAKCGVSVSQFYETLKRDLTPVKEFKLYSPASSFIQYYVESYANKLGYFPTTRVVTSRGDFWLDHTDLIISCAEELGVDYVSVIPHSACKVDWCMANTNILALFEDRPATIERASKFDFDVYIANMKYNRDLEGARFDLRTSYASGHSG